jgi:hypothetical protein
LLIIFREQIKNRNQYSVVYFDNGSSYQGEWRDQSTRAGFGIQKWVDSSSYAGYWENDKANGYGLLTHANGDVYEGYFGNDKCEGYGIYTKLNGTR